jgi:hypothetical protein
MLRIDEMRQELHNLIQRETERTRNNLECVAQILMLISVYVVHSNRKHLNHLNLRLV